jgi:hypothetical protein
VTQRVQLKRAHSRENGFIKDKKRFQLCFVVGGAAPRQAIPPDTNGNTLRSAADGTAVVLVGRARQPRMRPGGQITGAKLPICSR